MTATASSRDWNACWPKISLVENETNRSRPLIPAAARSVFAVPIMFTSRVEIGLLMTVLMPAMAAQWMTWVGLNACISRVRFSSSRTLPRTTARFACERQLRVLNESRSKLS